MTKFHTATKAMTTTLRVGMAILLAWSITAPRVSAQELSKQAREAGEAQLKQLFLGKQLEAKVTFPAYKDGIDIKTDGSWNMKFVTRDIKDHGFGIEVGDRAAVTDVKLKGKSIEIHLNGGGAGTFGDALMTSKAKKVLREGAGGKAPGGSRINLQFDRHVSEADLTDVEGLLKYLEPIVDPGSLKQAALQRSIPEEFKDAAAKKVVLIGMDKATVFAIMGEPKAKTVDVSSDPPTEKWQFELSNLATRIVTFSEGKVVKVVEM